MMAKKRILETVHETAKGLHKAGVMDTRTMREFDALCLPPVRNLSCSSDQTAAHAEQGEPGSVCGLSQHESVYCSEVGAGSKETERSIAETPEPD